MEMQQQIVTLLTDFGTTDGYVAAMKGVMLRLCPQARLVDITHVLPPQDVRHAAFSLYNAARFFPPGSVHLAVVDPGVGTQRRPLAVHAGGMFYVGPDNGLFSLVMKEPFTAIELNNSVYFRQKTDISPTFHGRDIFAPVAAHLASGVPLMELGLPVVDPIRLHFPMISLRFPFEIVGEVLYLDRFGNAVTNIGVLQWEAQGLRLVPLFAEEREPRFLQPPLSVECESRVLPLLRTYGEVARGGALALLSSNGFLEVAVRNGDAGADLGLLPGDSVVLRFGQ